MMQVDHEDERHEGPCSVSHGRGASSLLGAGMERGFVVRGGHRRSKRGGMGAVRVKETYFRSDSLLVAVSDTTPSGSADGPKAGQHRRATYVCPSADFLHCYLELFDRLEFDRCFRDGYDSSNTDGGGGGCGQEGGRCTLLLLYSELSKLTGSSGALSIRRERRLMQLARSLPGTLVFFDKFCPDLRRGKRAEDGLAEDRNDDGGAKSGVPAELIESRSLMAACEWCRSELDVPSVTVLSDDAFDGCVSDALLEDDRDPNNAASSAVENRSKDREGSWGTNRNATTGVEDRDENAVHVLSLNGFLRKFVPRGQAADVLEKRGALLRAAHVATKAESALRGRSWKKPSPEDGDAAATSSPLLQPHPSRAQLEAMMSSGEVLKGKLNVFEHNPREAVVLVSCAAPGKGRSGGGMLEEWSNSSGRARVLVIGREGMNRSVHGDIVAVRLLPRRRWRAPTDRKKLTHVPDEDSGSDGVDADGLETLEGEGGAGSGDGGVAPPGAMPTGVVVSVIEEGRRPYVVTIQAEEGLGGGGGASFVLTVPMDARVPKIRIKTRQLSKISGQRLVVVLDDWEVGSVFPSGHYVQTLGPVGEVSSEAAALLVECEASFEPFSFNALASLPRVPQPPKERDCSGSAGRFAPRRTSCRSSTSQHAATVPSNWEGSNERSASVLLESQKPWDTLLPPPTLASRERPEDGFGKAPRWEDSGWQVRDVDVVGRRDLRGVQAMSVDPAGCQDIDDAMHIRRISDEKLEVGVHIADVTNFLAPDGPLDKEARVRGTTVYLVHRRIDMLPTLLSSDLCSLHAGKDRLSVSVVWEVEEDGEDINFCRRPDGSPVCWFGRTVIHSVASMTYDQAQMLVEEGKISKPNGHKEPPLGQAGRDVDEALQPGLARDLRLLTRFARSTRKERTKNGALDLSNAGAELKFKIDPASGVPLAVAGKDESEIHHTIAELMILANCHVAEKIHSAFPSASLVRVHMPPDPSRLSAFEGVAAKVGAGSAEGLAASLASIESVGEKGEGYGRSAQRKAGLLKSLAVRAMSEAEYVSTGTLSRHQADGAGLRTYPDASGGYMFLLGGAGAQGDRFGHFGLGLTHYTHFTSPIRRYADIVVHRLLLAALGGSRAAPVAAAATASVAKGTPDGFLGGVDAALPSSLAPSVIEMEEAAVGRVAIEAANSKARLRAGAGDASFVTNPDGTRTYNKVSISTSTSTLAQTTAAAGKQWIHSARSDRSARSSPPAPPPGMSAFPTLKNLPEEGDDDGDAMLDALLGMETPSNETSTGSFERALVPGEESPLADVSKSGRITAGWGGVGALVFDADTHDEEGGDSLVDALLDMDLAAGENPEAAEKSKAVELDSEQSTAAGNDAGELEAAEVHAGESYAAGSPPFGGAELANLCLHLNDQNRRAKRLAQRCQEMFLRLYFKDHSEDVQGLVLSLRSNGFIAYVPAFDAKGPVYLCDKDGQVQVDPALLGLPATAGAPPSKAFATLPSCRTIPGATVSLKTVPRNASKIAQVQPTAEASAVGNDHREEEVLEVRPPSSLGEKQRQALRLRVLDGITLRLSCEILPTQARLPKVRFLLAGLGTAGKSQDQTYSYGKKIPKIHKIAGVDTGHPTSRAQRQELCVGNAVDGARASAASRFGVGLSGIAGVGGSDGVDQCLYGVLQEARDEAVREIIEEWPLSLSRQDQRGCTLDRSDTGDNSGDCMVDLRRAGVTDVRLFGHEADQAPRPRESRIRQATEKGNSESKSRDKSGGKDRQRTTSAAPQSGLRSEIGAGRALFGGFVPVRHAPAASLYDFGGTSDFENGGVAALGSIYNHSGVVGGGGCGLPGGGGTLASLDEARLRQYTQEATARAQRLGAEKRNARVSKSKRQG